jgi:hypothetical protein
MLQDGTFERFFRLAKFAMLGKFRVVWPIALTTTTRPALAD